MSGFVYQTRTRLYKPLSGLNPLVFATDNLIALSISLLMPPSLPRICASI
ncbi:Uncharacterised protein [Vibrio cholerae]|nr:Uncharacterised protein [Vibrio cholerae]CSC80450.1 Uncharacterised protein [Vibrio cholerae]CSI35644.1 Uncharacterised protein [Vibrio cholerae]